MRRETSLTSVHFAPNFWCLAMHVGTLSTMLQRMVHQHQRQHGFGDRRRPDANARIVSTMGFDHYRLAHQINRTTRQTDARSWFHCEMHQDVLSG